MSARARLFVIAAIVLAAAGALIALRFPLRGAPPPAADVVPPPVQVDVTHAFDGAIGWLHGDVHVVDSLRAHPAVIVIWSDTDPRCLEGLPVVETWRQAYGRYGVRVVSVYAPDFSFGVDSTVPLRMAARLGLGFPIALDPSYVVRSRLESVAGKDVLVVGVDGRLLAATGFDRLDRADRAIRGELRRLHPELGFPNEPDVASAPASDIRYVRLGAGRVDQGPLATATAGRSQMFTTQFRFQEEGKDYVPYPVGQWTPTAEGLVCDRGGAPDFVAIRNPGARVQAVLSPRREGVSRVWILADNGWLGAGELGKDARLDARGASYVDVSEPRLYDVARGGTHVLRFSPQEAGVTIHAFAFVTAAATP